MSTLCHSPIYKTCCMKVRSHRANILRRLTPRWQPVQQQALQVRQPAVRVLAQVPQPERQLVAHRAALQEVHLAVLQGLQLVEQLAVQAQELQEVQEQAALAPELKQVREPVQELVRARAPELAQVPVLQPEQALTTALVALKQARVVALVHPLSAILRREAHRAVQELVQEPLKVLA